MTEHELPDWAQIVEKHAGRVFGVAMRILGSEHDAEDVAQDVFADAYRTHRSGPIQNWSGLLVRLATFRAIDRLRRKRSTVQLNEFDSITLVEPSEEAIAAELVARLRDAVGRLPDQQAAVFVLHYVEQMSREGIAASLGISVQAVSTALYKSRQRLTALLTVVDGGNRP